MNRVNYEQLELGLGDVQPSDCVAAAESMTGSAAKIIRFPEQAIRRTASDDTAKAAHELMLLNRIISRVKNF